LRGIILLSAIKKLSALPFDTTGLYVVFAEGSVSDWRSLNGLLREAVKKLSPRC
jgi:hypothetical protein